MEVHCGRHSWCVGAMNICCHCKVFAYGGQHWDIQGFIPSWEGEGSLVNIHKTVMQHRDCTHTSCPMLMGSSWISYGA